MLVFDFIHDETPLFVEGIKFLLQEEKLKEEEILGILEGNRWENETKGIQTTNRLHYFDDLDKRNIDLDAEIKRISNEYNNFNIYACDRYLIQKQRSFQKKILVYTYLFYENLFKDRPSCYFTTGIAYSYNLISYQVSKKFNVKHVSFYGIRTKNKTAICFDVKNTFNEVLQMYQEFKPEFVSEQMLKVIDDFKNRPQQPNYMANAINSSSINYVFIREFFIRFKKYYLSNKHKYDLFTRNPFKLSIYKLKKTFRAKIINKRNDHIFDKVNYSEKYLIFPLHMQPEASTLIASPFDVNQQNTIINISKILPLDTVLYVKEHRSALGQHSKFFYDKLKTYPNIKLISHKENMFELIKKSFGTICLSSTVGLEALLLSKPAIMLGDVFYNSTGLTLRVNSYGELKKVLDLVLVTNFKIDTYFNDYKKKIAYYLHCLDKKSYPFEFNVAKLDTKERIMRKENLKEFSKCIENIVFSL